MADAMATAQPPPGPPPEPKGADVRLQLGKALSKQKEESQSMRDEGIVTNPYCRFPLSTLQAAMAECVEAAEARKARLEEALAQQMEFDAKKKEMQLLLNSIKEYPLN